MRNEMKTTGSVMKRAREVKDITQAELAKKIGASPHTILHY